MDYRVVTPLSTCMTHASTYFDVWKITDPKTILSQYSNEPVYRRAFRNIFIMNLDLGLENSYRGQISQYDEQSKVTIHFELKIDQIKFNIVLTTILT